MSQEYAPNVVIHNEAYVRIEQTSRFWYRLSLMVPTRVGPDTTLDICEDSWGEFGRVHSENQARSMLKSYKKRHCPQPVPREWTVSG
jgi:hypothetical protein